LSNAEKVKPDSWLLLATVCLLATGIVMLTSASVPVAERKGLPVLYFCIRQFVSIGIGLTLMLTASFLPTKFWRQISGFILILSIILLIVLLIPGVARQINGSTRWFRFGPISIQPSEIAKFAMIAYLASYLTRQKKGRKLSVSFMPPLLLLAFMSALLLLEPDFGAVIVLTACTLGLLFLGGGQIQRFLLLILATIIAFITVAVSSPYRLKRLVAFLDPWADQFNTGYQLTQSLIAFGRGGMFGVGLGDGVQKLLYLPEAYTDFIFAVIAEELGLVYLICIMVLYAILVYRSFVIGHNAIASNSLFKGFLAYGIGIWLGTQSVINLGVTTGMLPTKGITLPLVSYGGCSMIIMLLSVGILFRIDFEKKFE